LVSTQPPTQVPAKSSFGLVVRLVDYLGWLNYSFNGPVTITVVDNPGKDTLSGTLTVNAVHGVATFSGLKLHNGATGYRLLVSSAGAVSTLTELFTVT